MIVAAVFLFDGLALVWQVLFTAAFGVVVAMFAWTVLLFGRAGRADRHAPRVMEGGTEAFVWVFLVPALDEERTIGDSVARLLSVPVTHRHIVVIDDASTDRTPEILSELSHPDVTVLRRALPDAHRGKAAALNHAYRSLPELIGDIDRSKVIVVVIDADGRLAADAPAFAAAHFNDDSVGGLQSLVRIYNRDRLLTWLQDVEFAVYGYLFQSGRNAWGTAGMGGNGQFNRLSALDDIADAPGPWRDRLTEDQDLGLRLVAAGWKGRQDVRAVVEQQGVPRLRPLLRQRTRWSQGNLQAMTLARSLRRAPFPLAARIELLAYLLMPLWQGFIGLAFLCAVTLALLGVAPLWSGGPTWHLAVVHVLAFSGTALGCVAALRRRGPRALAAAILMGHVYAVYTWMIWPVLTRSAMRQLRRRRDWSKTAREPLAEAAEPAPLPVG